MGSWMVFQVLEKDGPVEGLLELGGGAEGYGGAMPGLLEFAMHSAFTPHTVREYVVRKLLDSPGLDQYFHRLEVAGPYLTADLERVWRLLLEPDWDRICGEQGLVPLPRGGGACEEGFPGGASAYRLWVEKLVEADSPRELLEGMEAFFHRFSGSGEARYAAFRWNGRELEGVERPDPQTFEALGGLEFQKQTLLENTAAFVEGRPANDVLLVGGSGTGKSSCVKAALNRFAGEGLRLVEVAKQDTATLPQLMRALGERRCRYIVFIDDLSFERPDAAYLELKVTLDGQIERRPPRVLIYATSNRRRLIRESWEDREGDVHENDTFQEKLSLSERFGIRLFFPSLSQSEYFDIVKLLLEDRGIPWTEEIGRMAAAWATQYNGRSGRTAKQFVADFAARQKKE